MMLGFGLTQNFLINTLLFQNKWKMKSVTGLRVNDTVWGKSLPRE